MGIGRGEFLRLMGLALTGFALDPLQSVITNEDIYINKKLGILFYKPKGWGFIQVKDFGRLKNEQTLGNGWDEMKEEIWEDLGDPVCLATKYYEDSPESKGIFSPTITLHVTPKHELEVAGAESFEALTTLSEMAAAAILEDFKVIKRYPVYQVCGCNFFEYDAEYLFSHIDIKEPLKVELKVLKAEHNGFYYDFNCHQSSAQKQVAHREFEAFKKSIKLL